MSDDANDVTKALAAFGAPSIRYHSFGQAQIKPSSVVLPRRVMPPAAAEPAFTTPVPAEVRQQEPVAAPEPAPYVPPPVAREAVQEPVPAPRPAAPLVADPHPPHLRQAEPVRRTEPLRQAEPRRAPPPTIAPPPRPLAEWAAPVAPPAARPVSQPPPLPVASPRPQPVAMPATTMPPLFPNPQPAPVLPPPVAELPPAPPPPVPPLPAAPLRTHEARPVPSLVTASPVETNIVTPSKKTGNISAVRTLQDVFEFLAGGQGRIGAGSP